MRKTPNDRIEKYRVTDPSWGPFATTSEAGNNGLFFVPTLHGPLKVIASDGEGWDHVSVSYQHKTPSWAEMSRVKELFFEEEEAVMQLHPAKSEYVNFHPHTLHLWRPQGIEIPKPPSYMVGPK